MMQIKHPGQLLELSGFYWRTCALHAGVKLGIYTVLGDRLLKAEEVADAIGADPDATGRLMDALSAMGLLEKRGSEYKNTGVAARYLRKDSPEYMGYMILHHHFLVEAWGRLDKSVLSGKPVRRRSSFEDAEQREAFLMGMFNMASLQAPEIVKHLDLSGRSRLLDLGGGPGTYAIHFCRQYPGLEATVFDLPTTRPFAEKTIARFNMSDRISFAGGSYLTDRLPGKYDTAWLSHILHGEGEEDAVMIIEKAAGVLVGGGIIMIHEFILNNQKDAPLFPALFSLNMLIVTEKGRAYSEEEIMQMLEKAGFSNIRRLAYTGPTESGIIVGEKPE